MVDRKSGRVRLTKGWVNANGARPPMRNNGRRGISERKGRARRRLKRVIVKMGGV
jgi:hypothetical protein